MVNRSCVSDFLDKFLTNYLNKTYVFTCISLDNWNLSTFRYFVIVPSVTLSKCHLNFNKTHNFKQNFICLLSSPHYNLTELKWYLQVYKCCSNLLQWRQLHIGSDFLLGRPMICDNCSILWNVWKWRIRKW